MIKFVMVETRGRATAVSSLHMKCDDKEFPFPAAGAVQGTTHWTGVANIVASVEKPDGDGSIEMTTAEGVPLKLAVSPGMLNGIVSPLSPAEPALWFTVVRGEVDVEADGRIGILRRRPALIKVQANGAHFGFGISGVFEVSVRNNWMRPWREKDLLAVLLEHLT